MPRLDPDIIEEEEEALDEIVWEPTPQLRPGMDFHDGVAYYSTPIKRRVKRPATKTRPADEVEEPALYQVTSEHEGFWYADKELKSHGFSRNEQVFIPHQEIWSLKSTKSYLDNIYQKPDTALLFKDIRQAYTEYVEYTDEIYFDIMALYVMYTYVFRIFESTGYIHFNGTAASGKSRNLNLIHALAFNSVYAASMSAPSLFRTLAGFPGTTLLDETEGFDGERGEELRRILNSGYKEGARVYRTEKVGETFQPVQYDVFGPKVLASISPLEAVIASRCLVVSMRPAIRQLPEFSTTDPRWTALRDRLYLWALDNATGIRTTMDTWVGQKKAELAPKLISRQWEITAQYIILGEYVGGQELVERLVSWFNVHFAEAQKNADATDRLKLTLQCLPRVLATVQEHPDHMYMQKEIYGVQTGYMEEDQVEYFKTRHIGKNLETLGFKTRKREKGGVQIQLIEDEVRAQFNQRRVAPFEEDTEWLAGTVSYQNNARILSDNPPEGQAEDDELPWYQRATGDLANDDD